MLHQRVAEMLRDRFANTAAAEPEVLAHHFTQAGVTDAAIEWWGKAGDQALRRSAFQEAIAHLGKAIEMADREDTAAPRAISALSATGPAAISAASRQRKVHLQTAHARALMWSKGYGSEEAKTAFARALQVATTIENPVDRYITYY